MTELKIRDYTEAELDEYYQQQMAIGYSTDLVDRPACEDAYKQIYRKVLNKDLKAVYWVNGFLEAKALFEENGYKFSEVGWQARAGNWEIDWTSYYNFCARLGVEYPEDGKELLRLATITTEKGHVWWPCEAVVVACERPCEIHIDRNRRLHNLDGPALKYRDGFEVYAVEGVQVDGKYVNNPLLVTIKMIKDTRNAELRRAYLKIYGIRRYLKDTNAKLLDETPMERLYSSDEGNYMICQDGSTGREYELTVPDDVTTVKQAQEALSGLSLDKIVGVS